MNSSTALNEYLYNPPARKDSVIERRVTDIASALAKAPKPPPPELVWRGLPEGARSKFEKFATGDVFGLDGFQSSSIKPQFADNWGPVLLEIQPAYGGYINEISTFKDREYEYLLPHAKNYQFVGTKNVLIHHQGEAQARMRKVYMLRMLP